MLSLSCQSLQTARTRRAFPMTSVLLRSAVLPRWSHSLVPCRKSYPAASRCRGPNASNPARGRTLPGQERPSNGRPDASQRRPGSMLCPVGLPGALSVDILALLLYWPTYAPITVRLTSDTHVAYWQWRSELPLNVWATPTFSSTHLLQNICQILLRPLKNLFYMVFLSCYSSALL